MADDKKSDKTTITFKANTQRATVGKDGERVMEILKRGDELECSAAEARAFIAQNRAIEGKHGAKMKKGLAAAAKAAAD